MPKSVWEKAGDEARAVNEKLDSAADNAMDAIKEKTGRFTWAVIVGSILGILGVFALAVIF
jgi:acid phosphatase family membrane protein YuiD